MIELVLLCFLAGIVLAVPLWIVAQRVGARHGLAAMRGVDPRDVVPCAIEPVARRARLLPALDAAPQERAR